MSPVSASAAEKFDIAAAVASSAGGITALRRVLGALPAGLRVPLLIVQHLDPRHETVIADVLSRRSNMPVKLEALRRCTETGRKTGPVNLEAVNRIGRAITCSVTCSPLDGPGDGVVLLMEEVSQD
jgi:hypothetical protein